MGAIALFIPLPKVLEQRNVLDWSIIDSNPSPSCLTLPPLSMLGLRHKKKREGRKTE